MTESKRKKYTREFKEMIVDLYESGQSAKDLSKEYGIGSDLVFRWKTERNEKGLHSFPGNGKVSLTAEQAEIIRLKKALREAELERDILKKAVNIFSKNDGKSFGS